MTDQYIYSAHSVQYTVSVQISLAIALIKKGIFFASALALAGLQFSGSGSN